MAVSIIVEHIEIQVSVQPCKLIEKKLLKRHLFNLENYNPRNFWLYSIQLFYVAGYLIAVCLKHNLKLIT